MSVTHPADINMALATAFSGCNRLIADAEHRGDQKGADAWLVARVAIEAAEQAMRDARRKQDWTRKEPRPFPPTLQVSCPKCFSVIGVHCVFTEAELAGQPVIGGAGHHMVHRERANLIGPDLKPIGHCYPHARAAYPPGCKVCHDRGVISTGNNDGPCDCKNGDVALFNTSRGTETGAQIKARR